MLLLLSAMIFAQEPSWDVQKPPGDIDFADLDIQEGTWLSIDVHPDGKELVFDLLGDIYLLPIEGGEAKAVSSGMAWDMQPRFHPDGTTIIFTSDRGGGDNIWTMDRDGSNPKERTTESFRLLNQPSWSPDGKYFVARKHFTNRRSLGTGEIWLYHAQKGNGIQLTQKDSDQKDVGEPQFSPDGSFVYYSKDVSSGKTFQYNKDPNGQIYAIYRLSLKTGTIEFVTGGSGSALRPRSPARGRACGSRRRLPRRPYR